MTGACNRVDPASNIDAVRRRVNARRGLFERNPCRYLELRREFPRRVTVRAGWLSSRGRRGYDEAQRESGSLLSVAIVSGAAGLLDPGFRRGRRRTGRVGQRHPITARLDSGQPGRRRGPHARHSPPGRSRPQPQRGRPRPAAPPFDRHDRRQRIGKKLAGLRYALCRRTTPLYRDIFDIHTSVSRQAGQARRRPHRRHPPRDRGGARRRRRSRAAPSARSPRSKTTSRCSTPSSARSSV